VSDLTKETTRSASANGGGFSHTALTGLNIAVVAPMPSASTLMAAALQTICHAEMRAEPREYADIAAILRYGVPIPDCAVPVPGLAI